MKRLLAATRFAAAPLLLLIVCALTGCASYHVGGAIQNGRAELRYGDPKLALIHFQEVAELDPDYVLNFSLMPEGVWTYIGRAHYLLGNFDAARMALERARELHEHDNFAKLYVGLVLARQGNRERGLREIVAGLQGFRDWFEYVDFNLTEGRYWDPSRRLRNHIDKSLEVISGREFAMPELLSDVEWYGKEFEEEIERARRRQFRDQQDDDRRRDRSRDRNSHRSGSRSHDRGSRGRR